MRRLLKYTAALEAIFGIGLLAVPSLLARILIGLPLDAPADLLMARLAGVVLLALGVAYWFASRCAEPSAARGAVAAALVYNIGATGLLVSARVFWAMTGIGLLPAAALHVVLAIWCIACLRR